MTRLSAIAVLTIASAAAGQEVSAPAITTMRVPGGGIQPEVTVGTESEIHLVYYKGEPRAGDLFYVRSTDGGENFSAPIRINSEPGSALAMGTIRGPHLALGGGGRLHVAWIGSARAAAEGPHGTPLFYTRLNNERAAFEAQRNVIQERWGVDAGASLAADQQGNVYVAWHAPGDEGEGEQHRRVWVARSSDDGVTFSTETMASSRPTGACACCGMRAFADSAGSLYMLYRSANKVVNRHTYLIASGDRGASFRLKKVHDWKIGQCMMSASALAEGPRGVLAAWETKRQVYFAPIDPVTFEMAAPISAPGRGPNRKHPALAASDRGQVLLAWTEGTSWGKGGSVAWQVFDAAGQPIADAAGRAEGLPAWSLAAAFARPDGSFVVVY